tara:strand:+ start:1109 stop:1372 length:264 start_codon:yes stop_codon:yes gene_type:complete
MAEESKEEPKYTTDEIAHNYKCMGDSVTLINGIIAGTERTLYTTDEKKECVNRNVQHLETMKAQDYWTSEDMTAVDKAITDADTFTG